MLPPYGRQSLPHRFGENRNDRPEGSSLGRYHYVIEVEDKEGITAEQIEAVCASDDVRFAGRFDSAEK